MRKNNMDAIRQQPKLYGLPAYKSAAIPDESSTEEKRGWFFRRAVDLGVITMANSQPKPPGFFINFSTVTVLITILVFFGGLSMWLWNVAYQKGVDDFEKKQILERLDKAEQEVKKAKDLQLYNQSANEERHKEEKKK
jgi:hypothetical protein